MSELDVGKAKKIISDGVEDGLSTYFSKLSIILVAIYMIIAALGWAVNKTDYNRDSTDSDQERSGMKIHTDNLTSCQYLSSSNGGLTPRLNALGKPMGCK